MKGDREVWTYTESIGGKTYTVRRTTRWVSDTEKVVTHEREGDSSTADVMRMTKVLKGRGKVASSSLEDFYEFCDLFEGRWMRDVILIADWPVCDQDHIAHPTSLKQVAELVEVL